MEADHRQGVNGVALRFTGSALSDRLRTAIRSIEVRAATALLIGAATILIGAASARAADPVIAAAGDIACDPGDSNFRNGEGSSSACRQKHTSDLLVDAGLSNVLVLGDNQYDNGALSKYQASYHPSWGRVKSITRPVPGNHEPGSASGYYDYFNGSGVSNGPAGQRGKGWYSYDLGSWHLIALNSKCDSVDCAAGGEQEQWLRADLAAHPNSCILAYWHHARFSSGHDGDNAFVQPFWQALSDAQADVVLNGHSHNYERFAPMDANGTQDQSSGIREFVVGTGGAFFTGVSGARPNSVVRQNHTYGVLKLTLHSSSYDWQFVPEAGKTFTDSGSASCHHSGGPPPPDTQAPTVPTNFAAAGVGPNRVDISWRASSDNVGVTGYEIYRDGSLIATRSGTSHSDTTVVPNTTYTYQVRALDAAGNRSAFGNIATATTPPPPDTQPPTVPTSLAGAAAGPTRANLSWGASADNVGVTAYEIFRDGALLATATGTSYSDPTVVPSRTYSYQVRALDAAGNRSAFGNTATVTPPGSRLTIAAEADARVEESSSSTNFGTSYLRTDGGSGPDVDSYLRFAVRGLSGPVESAKLRVYAYTGSADGPAVYSTGTGWSETGVTWASRPAPVSGATDDKGAIPSNSWVEYDVTPFVKGDGTYSFRLATSSSDGLEFRSREHTDAGLRPQLVVTLGPPTDSGQLPAPPLEPPGSLLALPGPQLPQRPFASIVDRQAPQLTLGGRGSQRLVRRAVRVTVSCSEQCTLTASATLSIGRASSSFRSRKVERVLGAGRSSALRFRFSRRAVRSAHAALRRTPRLFATVAVNARDAAGNSSSARRKIRLKR